MKEYSSLYRSGQEEIVIEKSRFIGYGRGVHTEDEALEFIASVSKKHREATHNVWAYIIGETKNIQRYSDDGEPSGTAGIPMLEVLKKEDLTNSVLVVTRYFGGIKLGAGGLVRAYTKAAALAVQACEKVSKKVFVPLMLTFDYSLLGKVQNDLSHRNITHGHPIFTDKVQLKIFAPQGMEQAYKEYYTDLMMGNVLMEEREAVYLDLLGEKILLSQEE